MRLRVLGRLRSDYRGLPQRAILDGWPIEEVAAQGRVTPNNKRVPLYRARWGSRRVGRCPWTVPHGSRADESSPAAALATEQAHEHYRQSTRSFFRRHPTLKTTGRAVY